MPQLILMRHAKAANGSRDFKRPLSRTGREQANAQAGPLSARAAHIDLVLVSAAERTMQTLEGLKSGGLQVGEVRSSEELYGAGWHDLLAMLREVPSSTGTVLVVGHEPTMSITSAMLASEDSPGYGELRAGFPTATAAIGTLPEWRTLEEGGLTLSEVLRVAI
ncbi:SixA phosphatase family protein [Ancrocorticia populi]|uniref:Histidine phosphatase n=1 Tax=Ancrocorticia populi TaxID=2175228 RepID=A0A2V1KB41_9ACTO|nr:histidine phosphatase family protein [Ancrocorticia populi]PWF26676.1 histidine phosphatase [Ancrocorticia populi]